MKKIDEKQCSGYDLAVMETTPATKGRPRKDEGEKVKPLSLKLSPALLEQLNRIRGTRKWPDALQLMANKWEGVN